MRWHDTATILRASQVEDPYGGTGHESDWSTPTSAIVSCSIQPRQSLEANGDRELLVGAWVGYFPADTDLLHTDRISWRGRTLTVDGDVAPWVQAGAVHHLEVPLQDVES